MPWGSCPTVAGGRHSCAGSVPGRSGLGRCAHGTAVPANATASWATVRRAGTADPFRRLGLRQRGCARADRSWMQPQTSLHPATPITSPSRPSHTTLSLRDLMEGTVMSIIEDIQRRSAHVHWPQGIVPEQADLLRPQRHRDRRPCGKDLGSISSTPPPGRTGTPMPATSRSMRPADSSATASRSTGSPSARTSTAPSTNSSPSPASAGTARQTSGWPTTPGCSSRAARATTYVVMEETGTGASPKRLRPAPIPATGCTAVTTCGTSASSSSAKAATTSGGRTPAAPRWLAPGRRRRSLHDHRITHRLGSPHPAPTAP